MGLSSSEDRMIVAGVVLAWYRTVTDGRTVRRSDGRTESIIAKTALCIASYADALSIIRVWLTSHLTISGASSTIWLLHFLDHFIFRKSHKMAPKVDAKPSLRLFTHKCNIINNLRNRAVTFNSTVFFILLLLYVNIESLYNMKCTANSVEHNYCFLPILRTGGWVYVWRIPWWWCCERVAWNRSRRRRRHV